MNKQSVTIMMIVTAVIQLTAAAIALLMTVGQSSVKAMYASSADIAAVQSVPYGSIIRIGLPFLVYAAGLLVAITTETQSTRLKAGWLVACAVIVNVLSSFGGSIVTAFVGYIQGAMELASYSMLESAISQATVLFQTVSFALFCMACGGYCSAGDEYVE